LQFAYVRGSSIKFIILPDILSKAPFFNRIKLWRKFKGHAVFGINTVAAPRGQSAVLRGGRGAGPRGAMPGRTFTPNTSQIGVPPVGSFPRPGMMPIARPGLGYAPPQQMNYGPPSGYRG